jgi:hypothetical protein
LIYLFDGQEAPEGICWALPFSGGLAYPMNMTKLLERALEAVRRLPQDSQDQIALAMLSLSGKQGELGEVDPTDLRI